MQENFMGLRNTVLLVIAPNFLQMTLCIFYVQGKGRKICHKTGPRGSGISGKRW